MKILLAGNFPDNVNLGSPKVMIKLREEFTKKGHFVKCIFENDLKTILSGHYFRYLNSPIAMFLAIKEYHKKFGAFDVVQVSSGDGFLWGLYKKLNGLKSKYVCITFGLEHLDAVAMRENEKLGLLKLSLSHKIGFPLIKMRSVELSMRFSDVGICLNNGDRKFIISKGWLPPHKIKTVPAGIAKKFFEQPGDKNIKKTKSLLYVGTWIPRKGVKYLIESYSLVADKFKDVSLSIMGAAADEKTIKQDFPEKLRNRINVIPWVTEEEQIRIYKSHLAFVFPSIYEGFGMVFLEAMASNLPVITTGTGGTEDIIENGKDGFIVPKRNSRAIADTVEKLLLNHDLQHQVGTRAKEKAKNFLWETTAEKLLCLYKTVI